MLHPLVAYIDFMLRGGGSLVALLAFTGLLPSAAVCGAGTVDGSSAVRLDRWTRVSIRRRRVTKQSSSPYNVAYLLTY